MTNGHEFRFLKMAEKNRNILFEEKLKTKTKKVSNICDDEIESNDAESNCAYSELNSPADVTINDLMSQINTNDTNFQENAYIPPDHENPSCSQIDSISTVPAAPQINSNLVKKNDQNRI